MHVLTLWRPSGVYAAGYQPTQEHMAAMGELVEEMTAEGVLLDMGAFLPAEQGALVRRSGDEYSVVDHAHPESKALTGYAILKVASKEEAIAQTKRFMGVAGDGETEILMVFEMPE